MKAVIFDCDGVVVDSEPLIFEAAKKVFAKYGVDLKPEDVQAGIGAGEKYVSHPREKYGLTDVSVEQLMEERTSAYREIAKTRLRSVDGFEMLIAELRRKGLKTALASSSSNEWVRFSLQAASIDPKCFDVIVDSDTVARKKPFPDLFLQAAKELGILPGDCVIIEDALPGIEAAHQAGIRCIALVGTLPETQLRSADFIAGSLLDVVKFLDAI